MAESGKIKYNLGCILHLAFVLSLISSVHSNPSCPKLKPGMVNVHLVCHTHDDVGWLKTVDQYYYGSRKTITWVGVQYILDSVIPALHRDPKRKFIFVESAFFFRWWDEQDQNMKNDVKKLVENGQFEFINGGWCMNDEASAHYNAIIDQMTLGLRKLNDTFGPSGIPRIAWQIDPFGHSKEQASLFAQMGMDGLFFGRLDYADKVSRYQTNQMEMVWKGSDSLGKESWLFTGVLPNGYSPPKGFCFDLLCPDDPIMDDPTLEDYNKDKMVDAFVEAVEKQKSGYATSNLIMTMGEDFDYVYAEAWYKNLDKLIKYVNERQSNGSKINVVYSTPSCYLDALHATDTKWPTKSDDFFPYESDPHAFWTGYFTSRPTLKGYIRQCNNLLQAVKQIAALTGVGRKSFEKLEKAMAVAQHHDAVTGTAKQHVTDDYSKRLAEGVEATSDLLSEGFRHLATSSNSLPGVHRFEYCPQLNISSCWMSENHPNFVVNIYNPVSRPVSRYIRIPISEALNYSVTDAKGDDVKTQIVPIPRKVRYIPGRNSKAKFELVFQAKDLPALSAQQFLVRTSGGKQRPHKVKSHGLHLTQDAIIKKGNISIALDVSSKKLKSIGVVDSSGVHRKLNVSQGFLWYAAMKGNNTGSDFRASGAYIFRPDGTVRELSHSANITAVYDGPLVAEIHQVWNPWISQVLRLYKDQNYVEIEWLVGPIPIEDGIGKEIVNRLQWDDMVTQQTFYTDANGREMQKRVKDKRQTWNLNSTEPVSQNYYPVTSRLIVHSTNGKGSSAFMNDRAQGGTSLGDGQMELMVHRRLLFDDAFGVGEALNETAFGEGLVSRGRHYLLHSDLSTSDCDFGCQHRTLGEELLLQPIITFSSDSSFFKKSQEIKKSALASPLPPNIRLLTLEPLEKGRWLIRLENYFQIEESSKSGSSVVDVKNLFSDWSITRIEEVTLGANQFMRDSTRLQWKTVSDDIDSVGESGKSHVHREGASSSSKYSFSPMQIRTFIVSVKRK